MTRRYRNTDSDYRSDEYYEEEYYDYAPRGQRRLRRNKIDGIFGGVCSGLADYYGMDAVTVRFIFVLLFFFTGLPLLVYPILWVCIPSDKRAPYYREYREARRASRPKRRRRRREEEEFEPVRVRTSSFRDVKSKFRSLEERLQDLERSVTSKEWRLHREFRDLEN